MAAIREHVDNFVHTLKILVLDLERRRPGDPKIYRAKQRVVTGISVDPLSIAEIVGTQLLAHRDKIYARDVSFFLERSYDDEILAEAEEEKRDLAAHIVPVTKDIARGLGEADRLQYIDLVVNMLDDWVEIRTALLEAKKGRA